MPADVSFQDVISHAEAPARPRRLPIGVGLAFAACMSAGLWIAAAAGLRAIFS